MQKQRYSGVDVHNWKVVDIDGKVIPYHATVLDENKKPVKVTIYRYNGYRSALRAAKVLGKGTPIRE